MSVILNVLNYLSKLGFSEERPEIYEKNYGAHRVELDLAGESITFGLDLLDDAPRHFSQLNFVVLELVDRLLRSGLAPVDLRLGPGDGVCSVRRDGGWIVTRCEIWEDLILHGEPPALRGAARNPGLYTSRLKAGIIEHWFDGAPGLVAICGERRPDAAHVPDLVGDLVVRSGVLVACNSTSVADLTVPAGVRVLGNGVFWRHEELRRVTVPEGLTSLGGDTFYACTGLQDFTIPVSVEQIGDNPFANCPGLTLSNRSPHFLLENGNLLSADRTRLIYASIRASVGRVLIPKGVVSVGKHAFHRCSNIDTVTLSPNVRIIENNPFSDIPQLSIENQSPHFVMRDGALYNRERSTLYCYEPSRTSDTLEIPEGVRIIGRHAFFNCRGLRRVTLPETLALIGYNPFAGCVSLKVESASPAFVVRDGVLFDRELSEIIFYPAWKDEREYVLPATVRKIGRSAFYANRHLERVVLPVSLTTIERSAFAFCTRLADATIPAGVRSVGEWAFEGCALKGPSN